MSSHLARGQFLFSWTGHGGHILWWENLTSTLMSAKKKNCAGSHCYSPGFLHADKYCAQFFFIQICWWKKEGSWESNVNRMFQIRPFERVSFQGVWVYISTCDGIRGLMLAEDAWLCRRHLWPHTAAVPGSPAVPSAFPITPSFSLILIQPWQSRKGFKLAINDCHVTEMRTRDWPLKWDCFTGEEGGCPGQEKMSACDKGLKIWLTHPLPK